MDRMIKKIINQYLIDWGQSLRTQWQPDERMANPRAFLWDNLLPRRMDSIKTPDPILERVYEAMGKLYQESHPGYEIAYRHYYRREAMARIYATIGTGKTCCYDRLEKLKSEIAKIMLDIDDYCEPKDSYRSMPAPRMPMP